MELSDGPMQLICRACIHDAPSDMGSMPFGTSRDMPLTIGSGICIWITQILLCEEEFGNLPASSNQKFQQRGLRWQMLGGSIGKPATHPGFVSGTVIIIAR